MKHGLICGRFQPLHQGHISLIKTALNECDTLTIAVGSAQDEINLRNPYTYNARAKMIRNVFKKEMLSGKIHIIPVRDINNPPMWAEHVLSVLKVHSYTPKEVDIYFAGTQEDAALFAANGVYTFILNREKSFCKSGTEVRELIRLGDDSWKKYVPEENWDIVDPFKFIEGDILIERRLVPALNTRASDISVLDYDPSVEKMSSFVSGEFLGVIRKGNLIPMKQRNSGFVAIDDVFELLDKFPLPELVERIKTMIIDLDK